MAGREPVLDALAEEWEAIAALGADLAVPEWELPTECPGWAVRDVVAHMVGTERSLLGDEPPPPLAVLPEHVKNEMGERNEAWAVAMRGLPAGELLQAFRDVTGRRVAAMATWDDAAFAAPGPSPVGVVPYREFMLVRAMDCWVHEQDIRVATARQGHDDSPAAAIAIDRLSSGLPFVVGKQAGVPDGSTVRFDVSGPLGRRVDIAVSGGRAAVADIVTVSPTTTLEMDQQTLWRLTGGRVTGADALERGLVHVRGDEALGRRVATAMAFMV